MVKHSEFHPLSRTHEVRTRLSTWLQQYRGWRKARRDRLELNSLGNAALKDLGIDRSEIPSIVHARGNERRRKREN